MKTRKLILTVILELFLFTVARAQNLGYHITGKPVNISPMPTKMYLLDPVGLLSKPLDSALVTNGQYQFKGNLTVDEAFGVTIATQSKDAKRGAQFLLIIDKGDYEVVSTDSIVNSTVAGKNATAHYQWEGLNVELKRAVDSLVTMRALDAYKSDKKLQAEVTRIGNNAIGAYIFKMYHYVKAHPDHRISPFGRMILLDMPFLSAEGKDTLISTLPERVKNNRLGQKMLKSYGINKARIDSAAKVKEAERLSIQNKMPIGAVAPDFTQNDPQGKAVSLSSFKGKYVLVDFWASWCAPCRAENPNLVKAYQQYKDKGLNILGVSLDGKSAKAAWIKAIENDGLIWTQVSDLEGFKNSAAKLYFIEQIPQNFLIGPDGTIIAKNLRGEELQQKLASVFNK